MIFYRDAVPEDAPLLADLSRRSFVETFGHLYREEDLAAFLAKLDEPRWREELGDTRYQIRLAEDDGDAVGFAKVGPFSLPVAPSGPALELRQLYLLGPWQGQGIAQAMMEWVLAQARSRGAEELFLTVWTENHRAQRFYRRYGFAYVAPYQFMVGDQADEDEIWRLDLRPRG